MSPLTGLNVLWNFATIYIRLRNLLAQPLKKRKRKIRYREAKTELLVFAVANQPELIWFNKAVLAMQLP